MNRLYEEKEETIRNGVYVYSMQSFIIINKWFLKETLKENETKEWVNDPMISSHD